MHQSPKTSELFAKDIRLLITGQSQSGKTELLYQLITNPKFGLNYRFKADQISLISPTLQLDNSQQRLISYLEKHDTNIDRQFDPDQQMLSNLSIANNYIQNLYDSQKELKILVKQQEKENRPKTPYYEQLLILDDVIGNSEFKTTKNSLLDSIITKCRHCNINIIILSQYYKSISSVVRANMNYLIFFNIPMYSEIQKVKDEVSGNQKKRFDEVYSDATNTPYSCLLIIQQYPPQYKFFKIYDKDKVQQYNLS